jgi:hypothetical protein
MCQRIHARYQIPIDRLESQQEALSARTEEALTALIDEHPDAAIVVSWLRTLFEAHLAEEEQVLWPLIAVESRA